MSNNKKSNKELKRIKKNLEHDVQVPLLVKKSKINNRKLTFKKEDEVTKKKREKVSDSRLTNAILICFVVLLLLMTSYVIVNRIVESNTKSIMVSKTDNKKVKKEDIFKKWVTLDNNAFVFSKEDTFYWYDDESNTKDNYYDGNYTYSVGKDALKEMGLEEKDFKKIFGEKIIEDRIYSLQLEPTEAFIEGKDQTSTYLPEGTKWWFIIVIKSDGTAIGYNKTLDIRYHLKVDE